MPLQLTLAQALAFAAFIALALAIVVFFRRASRLVAETRSAEGFRTAAADLIARVEATLDVASRQIEDVLRHQGQPNAVLDDLTATYSALTGYADEATGLAGPGEAVLVRDELLAELERLQRAIRMVQHGCGILTAARSEFREPEAQTSIKRGHLGILHSREEIERLAARAAVVGEVRRRRLFARPPA
jgi:hypothetical protein